MQPCLRSNFASHELADWLLALLVGAHALGRVVDDLPQGWRWRDVVRRE